MFQRLLLALDGSDSSLRAADSALELAALLQASLDILSVEETLPRYVGATEAYAREHQAAVMYFEQLHQPIRRRAAERGIQVRSTILSGHEVQTILAYLTEHACDCLILGAQGQSSILRPFLGSTADKVINHAPCSVLIVRAGAGKAHIRRFLLAFDGSPLSWKAFQESLALAQLQHASLHLLSVATEPKVPRSGSTGPLSAVPTTTGPLWSSYLQRMQERARAQAQQAGVTVEGTIREGPASGSLIQAAQQDSYDLIILGATGHEHPWSATLGGTARKIANEAPCSVLIVRLVHTQHNVGHLMKTDVATVTSQTPLPEVVSQLVDQRIKLLVVVGKAQHVQGIITLGSLFAHDQVFQHLDLQRAAHTQHLGDYVSQLFTPAQTAGEVMNRQPLVVQDTATIEAAAHWMDLHHVSRMPVVNAEGKLVGMLDQADLLQYYTDIPASPGTPEESQEDLQPEQIQTVGDTTLLQVPLIAHDTPLTEVLPTVQTTPLHRAIVIDNDGKAIGVIADRDILATYGQTSHRNAFVTIASRFALRLPEGWTNPRTATGPLTAQQGMRPRLLTVMPSTSLAEALQVMLTEHVKRLVVVDDQQKPLGLIDRQHVLRTLLEKKRAG
jgi:universal stress protein E